MTLDLNITNYLPRYYVLNIFLTNVAYKRIIRRYRRQFMYKLSDATISQISKLLQLAILTGTDIIDNLRTLKLVAVENKLELDPEYVKHFDANLEKMQEFLQNTESDANSATTEKTT